LGGPPNTASLAGGQASRLSWPTGFQPVVSLADRRDALSALTGWKPVLQSTSAKLTLLGGPPVPLLGPTGERRSILPVLEIQDGEHGLFEGQPGGFGVGGAPQTVPWMTRASRSTDHGTLPPVVAFPGQGKNQESMASKGQLLRTSGRGEEQRHENCWKAALSSRKHEQYLRWDGGVGPCGEWVDEVGLP
jgi:hypothetical protein